MFNLYHLKYFHDAVFFGSITKAARKNHITVAGLGQGVRNLEKELEKELIIHAKNRFRVTDEGYLLYEMCKKVFALLDEVREGLESGRDDYSGKLSYASSHSIASRFLTTFIPAFQKKYPDMKLDFYAGNSFNLAEMLEQGLVDIGIAGNNAALDSFNKEILHTGRYVLVKAEHYRGNDFIVGDKGWEIETFKQYYQKRYQKELPVTMRVPSWDLIAQFAERGAGIGLVPDFLLKGNKSLKRHHLQFPEIPYEICLFYKNRKPRTGIIFMEELKKHIVESLSVSGKAKR